MITCNNDFPGVQSLKEDDHRIVHTVQLYSISPQAVVGQQPATGWGKYWAAGSGHKWGAVEYFHVPHGGRVDIRGERREGGAGGQDPLT